MLPMSTFIDNFSKQAGLYARHRPRYPKALYDFLVSQARGNTAAWDCATGNGQVAEALVPYFAKVFATDASAAQLANASLLPPFAGHSLEYLVCTAERTPFPDHTFDLITVGQALHWFRFDEFYREVQRVTKPGGLLAVWGYSLMHTEKEEINKIIRKFYQAGIGAYWDQERKYVDEAYRTIPFPFREIETPDLNMDVDWSLEDCMGYLNTWSSVQKFREAKGYNPVDALQPLLQPFWDAREKVTFPLFIRAGTVE
jgi:ubiquinone/menaquinone biosynthesis C-methylase UbiE